VSSVIKLCIAAAKNSIQGKLAILIISFIILSSGQTGNIISKLCVIYKSPSKYFVMFNIGINLLPLYGFEYVLSYECVL